MRTEKEEAISKINEDRPIDAKLFGTIGAVTASLCENILSVFHEKKFSFMDMAEFEKIKDDAQINQIYWKEILFRVYWAASINMMRHQRWQAGCVNAFNAPENFWVFASSLRGLLEASQDAAYSLLPVPMTLAENRERIEAAITGQLKTPSVCNDLEDRLIHFVYAKKIYKGQKDTVPTSHIALEPKDYRNAINLPEEKREEFKMLYDYLCGICHPTANSLLPFWRQEDNVIIQQGRDKELILAVCDEYKSVISSCMSLSISSSALCLKALNWFSLTAVKCPEIEHWNFDDIPAWKKDLAVVTR